MCEYLVCIFNGPIPLIETSLFLTFVELDFIGWQWSFSFEIDSFEITRKVLSSYSFPTPLRRYRRIQRILVVKKYTHSFRLFNLNTSRALEK